MALSFDVLLRVLYQPKEAFRAIKSHVTLKDGVILSIVFAAVGGIITYALNGAYLGPIAGIYFQLLIASIIIMSVMAFVAMGWVSAALAGAFGGQKNPEKTVGLLGYGAVLGVVSSLVMGLLVAAGGVAGNEAAGANLTNVGIASVGGAALIGLLGIIFFVWGLWINGTAVSEANGVSLPKGVVSYFIAVIIVGLIFGLIYTVVIVGILGKAATDALIAA